MEQSAQRQRLYITSYTNHRSFRSTRQQ